MTFRRILINFYQQIGLHDVRDIIVREDIRVYNLNLYTVPRVGVVFTPLL